MISLHFNQWQKITSDPVILNYITGYKLEFSSLPMQTVVPFQIRFGKTDNLAMDLEITRLLSIGAIGTCCHEKGEFISNIFSRAKALS